MTATTTWHKTRLVPLDDYLEAIREYHQAANHQEHPTECEEDLCDIAHAIAMLSDEGVA